MNFISVEQEALRLPLQQRARLVYRLLASLDDLSESEVESALARGSGTSSRRN
jgi:hypothetical protein